MTIPILTGVTGATIGSAIQWDGGPAMLMAWWDAGTGGFGNTASVDLQGSPDGGTHWGKLKQIAAITSPGVSGVTGAGIHLPPMMIRGVVTVAGSPTLNNINVVIQPYPDAMNGIASFS